MTQQGMIRKIVFISFALLCTCLPMRYAMALCAVVKIEIKQELTLERQAFDANMIINNGLGAY